MKNKSVLSPIQLKTERIEKEKRFQQAIDVLNYIVKIRLAPSPIHGVGVFAMRNIRKGEKLYTDATPHSFDVPYSMFDKLRPEVRELLLGKYPLIAKGSLFYYPDTRLACYLNHAPTKAQVNYDAKADKTLRFIKKGQEILEDYTQIDGYKEVFPWITD